MSWRERILGESLDLLTDGSHNPPPAKEAGIPMLSARNVSTSGIDLDPGYRLVSEEDYLEEAKRAEPQSGDVLLTIVGTIGRTTVVRKQSLPFVLQRSVALLRPTRDLLPEYLSYWLESPEIQHFLLSNARGTAQKGVYLKTLRSVPISYPSLDAQKKICAKLDLQLSRHASCVWQLKQIQAKLKQARASILKAAVEGRLGMHENAILGSSEAKNHINKWQKEINELKDIKGTSKQIPRKKQNNSLQTCLNEKGWIQATVSEIANVQLGRQRSPKDHNGPWMTPYLRAANITWDGFALGDVNSMNFDPSERERFALKVGDILLNEASGSASEVGKPAIWRGEIPDCCFQNTLLRVRTIPSLQRWILLHFLADAKSGRFSRSSKGVGIHHLSANTLSAHIIGIPPPEQQERIVAEVDRRFSVLDQVEATVQTSLARCGMLRQAILKRAFGG